MIKISKKKNGRFRIVYRVKDEETGQKYALKVMD